MDRGTPERRALLAQAAGGEIQMTPEQLKEAERAFRIVENNKIMPLAPRAERREEARQPLPWLDISSWDHKPIPERKWAIRDRVPLNQAGLFSGEGGTGKSIIELMKN